MESIEDQFYKKYSKNLHHILNCRQEWRVALVEINAHNCLWDNAQTLNRLLCSLILEIIPTLKKQNNYLKVQWA